MKDNRRILVLPFSTDVDRRGNLRDPSQGVLARMIGLLIAEKLDLCPELEAGFFPLVATIQGKRSWVVPGRRWTEKDAAEFRAPDGDPDVLVFGHFSASVDFRLVVSAFDVRGRFIRFRKVSSGPVTGFLDHLEILLLELAESLGARSLDVNLRRAIGRFGTRDWLACRAYFAGRSNMMTSALGIPVLNPVRSFDPFVEAFTRDSTFQEAAEELALFALEAVLGGKSDGRAALRALEQAAGVFPDDFKLHGALGFCYRKLRRPGNARAAWERCLTLDRERESAAETLFQLGCLLEEAGDFRSARLRYEAALCEQDTHCDAHDRLAFSLANLGDLDGAIRHWKRVIRLDPERHATYGHLGWALEEKGALGEARENFERGLQSGASVWNLYFHYATFLVRHEEPERALAVLEKARDVLGESAWIHERMGAAYLVLGDGRRARKHLRAAVRMDPDGDFGKNAAQALSRLGSLTRSLCAFLSRVVSSFRRIPSSA
ncbi:MAG: tetratricopeptide repeat protein [Planctomycetota bacterium]